MAIWRACADLRLEEASKERFSSIHDCFTRELKPGGLPGCRITSLRKR